MAKVLCVGISNVANTVVAAGTEYLFFPLGQSCLKSSTTEALMQTTVRTAGVISGLSIYLASNLCDAISYLRTRINGGNGTIAVAIPADSGAGQFENVADTDSVSDGDEICLSIYGGAGGGPLTHWGASCIFTPTSGNVQRFASMRAANVNTASTTLYASPCGTSNTTSTSQFRVAEINCAGILQNLQINVSSNLRTTDTIFGVNINGSKHADFKITVGAGVTGVLEYTASTVSINAGDKLEYYYETGTGTENLTLQGMSCEFSSTDTTKNMLMAGGDGIDALAKLTTYYYPVAGDFDVLLATEANVIAESHGAYTASNMTVKVTTNTVDGNSTVTLRINGADSDVITTITGNSGAGYFDSGALSDSFISSEKICYGIVVGDDAAAGTLSLCSISTLLTEAAGGGLSISLSENLVF